MLSFRGGINLKEYMKRGASDVPYGKFIINQFGTNLLSLLPLYEESGSTAEDLTGNNRTGAYGAGVTVGGTTFLNGDPAPIIGTGANCAINWHTASLSAAWNGQLFTVAGWAKAAALSHWTDGVRQDIFSLAANPDFLQGPYSITTNNRLFTQHIAAGTFNPITFFGMYTISWFHWAITCSQAEDRYRLFVNGQQVGTQTGLGNWTTQPTTFILGASAVTGTNAWGANNALAYSGVWARELTPTEIDSLYSYILSDLDIMCVGDSKTQDDAWLYMIAQRLFDVSSQSYRQVNLNYGINGYNAAQMAAYVSANLDSATGSPSIILFNIGANDLTGLPAEATWKTNVIFCINAFLAKWPNVNIYIARPWRRTYGAEANTMAGWINDIVSLYSSNVHLGHDERIWFENGDDGTTYSSDGVHYNDPGQLACTAATLVSLGY